MDKVEDTSYKTMDFERALKIVNGPTFGSKQFEAALKIIWGNHMKPNKSTKWICCKSGE